MISKQQLAELRKRAMHLTPHGAIKNNLFEEMADTLSAALRVVEAAKKLRTPCNHKPEGWDALDKALAPFTEEKEKE